MDLAEFGEQVRRLGRVMRPARPIRCSDTLILMLEVAPGALTHPNIADLLAEACGATPAQRDMIVAKQHRGSWRPGRAAPALDEMLDKAGHPWRDRPAAKKPGKPQEPKKDVKGRPVWNARPVVMLSPLGKEVARYPSIAVAAKANGVTEPCVGDRCRQHKDFKHEFKLTGYTWRFSDEWDAMSREERIRDLGT